MCLIIKILVFFMSPSNLWQLEVLKDYILFYKPLILFYYYLLTKYWLCIQQPTIIKCSMAQPATLWAKAHCVGYPQQYSLYKPLASGIQLGTGLLLGSVNYVPI